jgi:hypothetical protein
MKFSNLAHSVKLRALLISSAVSTAIPATAPLAFASSDDAKEIVQIIMKICSCLLTVFTGAGAILLAWGVMSFILALKDESAEGKVQAITQISLAITLLAFSGILKTLGNAVDLEGMPKDW